MRNAEKNAFKVSFLFLYFKRFTRQSMRQHKFLHKIVLQEMKRRLYIPNVLPPLKTVANGYEYYSTTSAYGMVYLRKKLGEGRDAPEVKSTKGQQVQFTHHLHYSKYY